MNRKHIVHLHLKEKPLPNSMFTGSALGDIMKMKDKNQIIRAARHMLLVGCFFATINAILYLAAGWYDTGAIDLTSRVLFMVIFWFVGGLLIGAINWRSKSRKQNS